MSSSSSAAPPGPEDQQQVSNRLISTRLERRHPQTPSLDVIATQTPPQQDSRSSSSTNSPAPNEYEESDFFLGANDSQSSLGVPNLQDMQVNDDDECQAPINRLPNEILISIFSRLSTSTDQLHCMLTCKRWARNTVDQLWHRPSCTTWSKLSFICQTLGRENPYFSYKDFIKRLNLAALAEKVNDGSVMPLSVCTRVERLTLTNCKGLTDSGLIALVQNNDHLLALDISGDDQITEASIFAIAETCKRLQGLNVSGCNKISNDSMVRLAENCKFIKRLKLNDCKQLGDDAILAFAEHCPNLLEIDLQQCKLVGNPPVTNLLAKGQSLRELRLVNCELIDDGAFLSLPPNRSYEHLRILDLTSCSQLTDRAVERIIDVAPRLRNLVLAKCRNISDAAVFAISRLGKNLHYVHLGHCNHITDEAVKRLVHYCNRIRYIDLGCCVHLTDESVTRLATLPKLKRIGLVKCAGITDESIFALAKANQRNRQRRDAQGNPIQNQYYSHSSLERVHLSYCTNLTLKGIIRLLNACPRLTHLSLTGVQAFLRDDLGAFCRDAPPEFTEHQRNMFCVFSGQGVVGLRRYLNGPAFSELHDRASPYHPNRRHSVPGGHHAATGPTHLQAALDASFDAEEPDAVDDDDGLDDGSEMVIDTQPLLGLAQPAPTIGTNASAQPPPPPPIPIPPHAHAAHTPTLGLPPAVPPQVYPVGGVFPGPAALHGSSSLPSNPAARATNPNNLALDGVIGSSSRRPTSGPEAALAGPSMFAGIGASMANLEGQGLSHQHLAGRVASGAGPMAPGSGPSTAPPQGTHQAQSRGGTPYEMDNEGGSPASSSGTPEHS